MRQGLFIALALPLSTAFQPLPLPAPRSWSQPRLYSALEDRADRVVGRVIPAGAPVARPPTPRPSPSTTTEDSVRLLWTRQWWAVAFTVDLPDIPTATKVLGTPLAIWKDKQGEWRAFEDACPHRLAPLSEGRISPTTGDLQCAYHGWAFDAEGSCTIIPQSKSAEMATATGSPRACVRAYPTRVHQGVLFVFADASPEGWAASAVTPVPHVPQLEDEDYEEGGATFTRDLPYNYDTLLENLMDPAHVPYTHHGATGATHTQVDRENASPVPMILQHMNETNIKVDISDPNTVGDSTLEMATPSMTLYDIDLSAPLSKFPIIKALLRLEHSVGRVLSRLWGKPRRKEGGNEFRPRTMLVFYTNPMEPGKTRVLARFPRNFFKFLNPPRWISHMNSLVFTDGDNAFLHMQEREMRRRKGWDANLDKTFYMPTSSDLAVRAFRRWIKDSAGGAPAWAEGTNPELPPLLDRSAIFDRYHQHVKHCRSCQAALRNWRRAKVGLAYLSITTLGILAGITTPVGGGSGWVAALVARRRGLAVAGVLAAVVVGVLHRMESRLFYFSDYIHAKR